MAHSDPEELLPLRAADVSPSGSETGIVYALTSRHHVGQIKIGETHRRIEERIKDLNSQTASLGDFFAIFWFRTRNSRTHEQRLMHALRKHRVKKGREFFKIREAKACRVFIDYFERNPDFVLPSILEEVQFLREMELGEED